MIPLQVAWHGKQQAHPAMSTTSPNGFSSPCWTLAAERVRSRQIKSRDSSNSGRGHKSFLETLYLPFWPVTGDKATRLAETSTTTMLMLPSSRWGTWSCACSAAAQVPDWNVVIKILSDYIAIKHLGLRAQFRCSEETSQNQQGRVWLVRPLVTQCVAASHEKWEKIEGPIYLFYSKPGLFLVTDKLMVAQTTETPLTASHDYWLIVMWWRASSFENWLTMTTLAWICWLAGFAMTDPLLTSETFGNITLLLGIQDYDHMVY